MSPNISGSGHHVTSVSDKVSSKIWPEPDMSETWSETRDAGMLSGRVMVALVEFGHKRASSYADPCPSVL